MAAMAAAHEHLLATILIVLLLAGQTWSSDAYNNQKAKWLKKRLFHPVVGDRRKVFVEEKQPAETSTATGSHGWRTSLVNEDHRFQSSKNLTKVERIRSSVERSKSRTRYLDGKSRATPYGKNENMRRKTLQTPTSFESPVGATPGGYSMAFTLGTPPQDLIAIADTGSDLVWVQATDCTSCFPEPKQEYDRSASSSYTPLGCSTACTNLGENLVQCSPNCKYSYSYGDQSTTMGDFASETLSLGSPIGSVPALIYDFKFGCGLQNQGTLVQTDGIVGLGRGPVSLVSQIAPYLNDVQKFSYCLVSSDETSTVTSPILFGAASVANTTGAVYTPLLTPYDTSVLPFYYVNLLGISVGGTDLGIPASAFELDASGNGGTIFDSGTTYTALNTDAYYPVLNAFRSSVNYAEVNLQSQVGLDLCYDITGFNSVSVPKLTFHFDSADLDLAFENIFVVFSSSDQSLYMCLSLMEASGMNVFGNTQQQDFQVFYEEDALQIGWRAVNCTTI